MMRRMAYPVTWPQLAQEYGDAGDYQGPLQQLAANSRDPKHLQAYAEVVGVTQEQVKDLFDRFFAGDVFGVWVEQQIDSLPTLSPHDEFIAERYLTDLRKDDLFP